MTYPDENFYHSKWKSIVNVMKSSNLKISKIAQAGSRAKKKHRPDSDMDVIFAVAGNPPQKNFYPDFDDSVKKQFSLRKSISGEQLQCHSFRLQTRREI